MKKRSIGRAYIKTIKREIKKSFGRFIAIMAIIALGVGFLAGLLAATPDLKLTMSRYYDESRFSDIIVKSELGLTEDDMQVVGSMPEVETLMPAYVTDALMASDINGTLTTRIYGMPFETGGDLPLNKLELLSGRFPENENECVVNEPNGNFFEMGIGTKLKITDENSDTDMYAVLEYTVVGVVKSPLFISVDKEPSRIGTGTLDAVIYVMESAYDLSVYTDFFIAVGNEYTASPFSEEYDSKIEAVTDKLKALGHVQSQVRFAEVRDEALVEITDAQTEIENARREANEKLEEARKKIDDGRAEIEKSEAELDRAESEVNAGRTSLRSERDSFTRLISENEQKLKDAENEIASAKAQLDARRAELDAAAADVKAAKQLLEAGHELPPDTLEMIAAYDEGVAAFSAATAELSAQETYLSEQKAALQSSKIAAEAEFKSAQAELDSAQTEINRGRALISESKEELAEAEEEYLSGKEEAEQELSDAELELLRARVKLELAEAVDWYILDRNQTVGYASFSISSEKVADIAGVFPVFFLLIAILVALTTMTRMVEEERVQIGTLKALGFTKGVIMLKYFIYCGLAGFTGCVVGLASGFQVIPAIVYNAFSTMYSMPPLIMEFDWVFAAVACALTLVSTIGVAYIACSYSLKEKPAFLMLPRAPKPGKRIFLENITPLWSRLKFSHKSTARNIFRYKKHLFMTLVGIAGSAALVLAGFGLSDSLAKIADTQYGEILLYDLEVTVVEGEKYDDVLTDFLARPDVFGHAAFYGEPGKAASGGKEIDAGIRVPEDFEAFAENINFRERRSGEPIAITESSVILTEKLASELDVKAGDAVTIKDGDGRSAEFTVTGVCENYVGSFAYINAGDYSEAFRGRFDNNGLLIMADIDENSRDEAVSDLLSSDTVVSAQLAEQSKVTYDNLLSSLSFVVLILIISAGALALIVLYNLINVNISERWKELATLMVLGYYQKEVATYIFREIGILCVMGTGLGLVFGVFLHKFVVFKVETEALMFGREISPLSFVLSAILTLIFAAAVCALMYIKLKKINMSDSMKAVD